MADISKIKVPGGSEYDIKDTTARGTATTANSKATSAINAANSAYNSAAAARTRATDAYSLAGSAVPTSNIITTAQIEMNFSML